MAGDRVTQDVATNHGWFVLTTMDKMEVAEAKGELKEFFIYFKWAVRLLTPFIEGEKRAAMERDFKVLEAAVKTINSQPAASMNDQSKESAIDKLRAAFADTHAFVVFEALPKASIVKITQDAVIDLEKRNWQEMGLMIRSVAHSGLKSGVMQALEREEAKNGTDTTSSRT
jgi:hypothetical protein